MREGYVKWMFLLLDEEVPRSLHASGRLYPLTRLFNRNDYINPIKSHVNVTAIIPVLKQPRNTVGSSDCFNRLTTVTRI